MRSRHGRFPFQKVTAVRADCFAGTCPNEKGRGYRGLCWAIRSAQLVMIELPHHDPIDPGRSPKPIEIMRWQCERSTSDNLGKFARRIKRRYAPPTAGNGSGG